MGKKTDALPQRTQYTLPSAKKGTFDGAKISV